MEDLLFPRTDAGVLAQVILIAVAGVFGIVVSRHNRDLRIFVLGITVLLLALIGVRAVH